MPNHLQWAPQMLTNYPTSNEVISNPSNYIKSVISIAKPNNEGATERLVLVDYSEKVIAVFGDTIRIRDHFENIGGKFSMRLMDVDAEYRSGWIFAKSMLLNEVSNLLNSFSNDSLDLAEVHSRSSESSYNHTITSVERTSMDGNRTYRLDLVDYDENALVLFGDTKIVKEYLKQLSGQFTVKLKGANVGWKFDKSKQSELLELMSAFSNGSLDDIDLPTDGYESLLRSFGLLLAPCARI